jgi:hypothetical protein
MERYAWAMLWVTHRDLRVVQLLHSIWKEVAVARSKTKPGICSDGLKIGVEFRTGHFRNARL